MKSCRDLRARDIMTTPVVSVGPETPVQQIARLLAEHRISGVPVLAGGQLVGVVNEMDLLHRQELGTERAADHRSWVERLFRIDPAPGEYVKSHGLTAKDVLTTPAACIPDDEPVSAIALRFDERAVRRLVVVRDANVVGIVTRANLVRVLAAAGATHGRGTPSTSDEAIREALLAELSGQRWWNSDWSTVAVADGVVQFHGVIESQDEIAAARVAAENIPGVRSVEDYRQRYFHPMASM